MKTIILLLFSVFTFAQSTYVEKNNYYVDQRSFNSDMIVTVSGTINFLPEGMKGKATVTNYSNGKSVLKGVFFGYANDTKGGRVKVNRGDLISLSPLETAVLVWSDKGNAYHVRSGGTILKGIVKKPIEEANPKPAPVVKPVAVATKIAKGILGVSVTESNGVIVGGKTNHKSPYSAIRIADYGKKFNLQKGRQYTVSFEYQKSKGGGMLHMIAYGADGGSQYISKGTNSDFRKFSKKITYQGVKGGTEKDGSLDIYINLNEKTGESAKVTIKNFDIK